ncbi:MAG: hypothetical protein Q9160_002207 [Pyrenula sp. 1 TL-2023]
MAAIHNLLNPDPAAPVDAIGHCQLPSPSSTIHIRDYSSSPPPRKKPKVAKDAAVFNRNSIRGECRYPPCGIQDETVALHLQQHEVYPIERLMDYPRHIPYNSEKKTFQEKTGRESFEVFHYNFRIPGDEKIYCMMWDYNIGLVRTTPLFRCNGFSKTTPAKMLNRNPGLRELCHSITGGALVAQGYWMPFEAAKAVAATFCYHMRFALIPIFGSQFPEECLKPDHQGFGEMVIDQSIIRFCTEEAEIYRQMASEKKREESSTPKPTTPVPTKQHQLRRTTREMQDDNESDSDREASYPTTTPSSITSSAPGRSSPFNTPRSTNSYMTRRSRNQETVRTSPRKNLASAIGLARSTAKPNIHGQTFSKSKVESSKLTNATAGTDSIATRLGIRREDGDVRKGGISGGESISGMVDATQPAGVEERELTMGGMFDETLTDEKAAQILLSLRMGQTSLSASVSGSQRPRKRRASA